MLQDGQIMHGNELLKLPSQYIIFGAIPASGHLAAKPAFFTWIEHFGGLVHPQYLKVKYMYTLDKTN